MSLSSKLNRLLELREKLNMELTAAYRFKNKQRIEQFASRLRANDRHVADTVLELKQNSDANTKRALAIPLDSNIKIPKNAPLKPNVINLVTDDRDPNTK